MGASRISLRSLNPKENLGLIDEFYVFEHSRPRPKGQKRLGKGVVDSVGNSGGILCIWDPNSFRRSSFTRSDYFVIVRGVWLKSGIDLMIVVVYAPQEAKEKRMITVLLLFDSIVTGLEVDGFEIGFLKRRLKGLSGIAPFDNFWVRDDDFLLAFTIHRLKLRNGENTRFWVDNWYEGGVIKELFPHFLGMTTLVPCEDRYVWTLESDGVFSVASIRKEIDGNRFQDVQFACTCGGFKIRCPYLGELS
ncbi:hypothetical protein Tco_0332787 [Tanacetum coccineum]